MDNSPAPVCITSKFSSANDLVPYMHSPPVPSPLVKSPPCSMKPDICDGQHTCLGGILHSIAKNVPEEAKPTYHSVKFRPFISHRPPILPVLPRAKLPEILSRAGRDVFEELHLDPSKRFASELHVEEDDWVRRGPEVFVKRLRGRVGGHVGQILSIIRD